MHTKPKEISRSRLDSWDLGSEFFADDENEGDDEEPAGGEPRSVFLIETKGRYKTPARYWNQSNEYQG